MLIKDIVRDLEKNGTEGLYDYAGYFITEMQRETWSGVIRGLETEDMDLAYSALQDLQSMVTLSGPEAIMIAQATLQWFEDFSGY